jgi:RNA polymerase sigma-70 factor (ECF subfamily)
MLQELPVRQPADTAGFETLFREHFKRLHAYASTILKDPDGAEDVVQQCFLKLWKRYEAHKAPESPAAYLYRAVYNDSLNVLKHQKVKMAHEQYTRHTAREGSPESVSRIRELEAALDKALSELPEQCRSIFQLSRFEELKYREIAERLGLSVKTIEAQMGKALRLLRTKLAPHLPAPLIALLLVAQPILLFF